VYSNGASEVLIGKAIKKYNLPREKLTILTKCFGYVGEVPSLRTVFIPEVGQMKDYVNQGGLSRAAIFNAVNASLKRLDLEYIDLLQIHRFDPKTPVEETMEALHDLVKSGKVRYIGASSMWAVEFATLQFTAEKNGWTKFVSMQNHYNLLYREEEREMNRFCNMTGVGMIPVRAVLPSLHTLLTNARSGHRCAEATSPAPPLNLARRFARGRRRTMALHCRDTWSRTSR
jgi:aryl-alcohol dehydrogenase-like predicted oxidoreductase